MSAIDTNLPTSQLNPQGMGTQQGTRGPYDAYVSPSMTPGRTSAYQKRRFHTQNLPDAYVDRALRIRDSTEEIAWLMQQRYQTQVVLPLRIVEDLVLHVDHFEAWPTFFSVTPEQAVSHMLTQSASSHEVSLLRFSLQARLEHGFMGTPIGQERYNAMLNQFATSMNETANAEVARALLDATDPQQTWLQRHGQLHIEDLMNYLRWDLFCFGALQKISDNPLEIINQRVQSMMKAYGGRADTIIMSEDLEMYAQLIPVRKTRYYLGGQEAVDRVNGKGPGTDRNTGGIFNSIDPIRYLGESAIYIHRSMVVENQGDIDPWHRTRQIGEWNILEDTVRDHDNYRTDRRTIFVYNQDMDTMSPLTIRECIENCMMWNADGTLRDLSGDGTVDPRYSRDAKFYPFAVESNSYSPIKYCGDLSQEHFDLGDVNKLATTMINAAYRDSPTAKATDIEQITIFLAEMERRKRGGANAGRVLFDTLDDDEQALVNNFAERMRAVAPQSIFLDPALATVNTGNGRSAGRTLWETLVYAGAVPVFQVPDDTPAASRTPASAGENDMLAVLFGSFLSIVKPETDEDGRAARAAIQALRGDANSQIQQAAQYLREHPEASRISQAQLNAWIDEQVRLYREEERRAAAEATGTTRRTVRAFGTGSQLYGFVYPGTRLPVGLYEGVLEAGARYTISERTSREEEEEQQPLAPGFQQDPAEGFQQERSVGATIPVSIASIPMFQDIIGAGVQAGKSSHTRRQSTAQWDRQVGDRLGSMTEQIGAHFGDDEAFFATRQQERGHMASRARRLGLGANLSPAQLAAALGTMSSNLEGLATYGMPLARKVMAVIFYGIPFTKGNLLTLADNNIVVPVTFIPVRPHITVEGRIMVKCLSGGGAGYTYYAHANVMVGDNVLTKTHTINMHFYLRSHVHAPRNVFIIPDVFINGYHGGMGVEPITEVSQYQPNAMAPGRPCMLIFMCSYKTSRQNVPNPFDISGHFNSRYRVRGAPSVSRPAYDTAAFYAPLLGLGGISGNVDLPVLYEQHRNTLVYRGHQEEDDGKGGYTLIEPNTGHWGPKVYKGCKAAREGESYVLEDVHYARHGGGVRV